MLIKCDIQYTDLYTNVEDHISYKNWGVQTLSIQIGM